MPIYKSNFSISKHVYNSRPAHDKRLYLILITCHRQNTFLHYRSCNYTIEEYCVVIKLHCFPIENWWNSIEHNVYWQKGYITQYMYSPTMLSSYMYLYYNFSSGAPPSLSVGQQFFLAPLSVYRKSCSIMWSAAFHTTMQQQEHVPHTPSDNHASLDISRKEASFTCRSTLQNVLFKKAVRDH